MPIHNDFKPDEKKNPPLDSPATKELAGTIKSLLQDPDFREFLSKQRQVKRPRTSSKMSNFSYYREPFGLQMKVALDTMMETRRDCIWRYSNYPELSPSSLYQRINQSLNFLLREMDHEGKYAAIRDMIVISRKDNKSGIVMAFIRDKLEGREFKPDFIGEEEKVLQWREEIDKFLDDPDKTVLHLKNLALTYGEIQTIQNSFLGVEGIICVVTEREIKVVKESVAKKGEESK